VKGPAVAIGGPTATGKSEAAVLVALALGGEVVSADSMQIYRGLDIGTAKPSKGDLARVRHHMIDIADPTEEFSVSRFDSMARREVQDVQDRGLVPVICGGTGMYLDSLIRDAGFSGPAGLRADEDGRTADELYRELRELDPEYASSISKNDLRRIKRALGKIHATGRKVSEDAYFRDLPLPQGVMLAVLWYHDRKALYGKIDERVDRMAEQGLVEEARRVFLMKDRCPTASQAIGYKELFPYFEGTSSLDECLERVKKATRNFAKRQMTWFRRDGDAFFVEMDGRTPADAAEEIAAEASSRGIA
jgi:tRNA dimethylallyltransferase